MVPQLQRLAIPETRYVNLESNLRLLGDDMMLSHGVASESGISKFAANLILAQQDDTSQRVLGYEHNSWCL